MFQRNNTTQKEYLEQENIIISTFQSCKSHISMQHKIIDLSFSPNYSAFVPIRIQMIMNICNFTQKKLLL